MPGLGEFRAATRAGWACLALLFCINCAVAMAAEDVAQQLKFADSIKTSDHAGFLRLMQALDNAESTMRPEQALYLRYLEAWQVVYEGKYEAGISQLEAVIAESRDANLRFRAGVTVVNALVIASRNEAAFTRLSRLLEDLPQVSDLEVRQQGLGVASLLYTQAGEYDLGSAYADKIIAGSGSGSLRCRGHYLKLDALYRSGRLRSIGKQMQDGISTCVDLGETLWANLIRVNAANLHIEQDRPVEAIKLLQANYDDVQRTRYPRLVSEFDALLGAAYFRSGDAAKARRFAQRAVDGSIKGEVTKPLVDAYRVLYLVSKNQGDYPSALAFHEKFATADKGYLTEASARVLAYQAVKQQVQEKKQQIDGLNKRNKLLQLEQKVSKSAAQTRGLYILLLLSVLAFIAMWLYITKRSQLHFMKLARRDGLTGIFNRAHFADAAESILAYCRKGEREACVVLIDLDHFKRVNDKHGHAAGDTVLRRTVQACQAHLRSIDIIGRLGGEEFGIVLPDCDPQHARELAEQFRLAIADMSSGEGGVGFPVSASFGVTSSRWSSYNLRQLIIHADKALYAAKHHGRNRVELFDPASLAPAEVAVPQAGSFDRRRA